MTGCWSYAENGEDEDGGTGGMLAEDTVSAGGAQGVGAGAGGVNAAADGFGAESGEVGTESGGDGTGTDGFGTESARDGTGTDGFGTESARDGTAADEGGAGVDGLSSWTFGAADALAGQGAGAGTASCGSGLGSAAEPEPVGGGGVVFSGGRGPVGGRFSGGAQGSRSGMPGGCGVCASSDMHGVPSVVPSVMLRPTPPPARAAAYDDPRVIDQPITRAPGHSPVDAVPGEEP